MAPVCLYNVECTVLVQIGLRSDFTLLVVISILFCSPKMYGSQSGSRLFILREPFSVYGSFGSRAPVFSYSLQGYFHTVQEHYSLLLKQFLKTFDYNFTLVYYKGD